MGRVVAAITLFAVLTSPTVARARLFCRFTGIEITDCPEQQVSDRPLVRMNGCCDRRVLPPPLGPATRAPEPVLPRPDGAVIAGTDFATLRSQPSRLQDRVTVGTSPPLFLQQRALLI